MIVNILDPEVQAELMTIPPAVAKVYEKKRKAGPSDVSMLKDQQLEAFIDCQNYYKQEAIGMHLIEGFAGTGKTFTIGKFIEWVLEYDRYIKIAVTAPTNKAVKVLKKSADFVDSRIKYLTIHSLLGLKEQKIDGKQVFVQDKKFPPRIQDYGLLVLDETSMLRDELLLGDDNSTGIIDYVGLFEGHTKATSGKGKMLDRLESMTFVQSTGLKVVFMGDPAQIPPIGKVDSLPFQAAAQAKYNISVSKLTDIVRQAVGNPIIETTMKIRQAVNRPVTFPTRESQMVNGKGSFFIEKGVKGHSELMEQLLEKYFCSENFKLDPDFVKVVAWRNRTVNFMNKYIRTMLYGKAAEHRIAIGEKLIVNKPILEGPMVLFQVNDELEVISWTDGVEQINGGSSVGGWDINYHEAEVLYEDIDGNELSSYIKIVAVESLDIYDEIVELLVKKAESYKFGTWERSKAWQDKYAFEEMFADVVYNYAITGHKSQGSTYRYTFVLTRDIDENSKVKERNQIKYTAASRPTDRVFLAV